MEVLSNHQHIIGSFGVPTSKVTLALFLRLPLLFCIMFPWFVRVLSRYSWWPFPICNKWNWLNLIRLPMLPFAECSPPPEYYEFLVCESVIQVFPGIFPICNKCYWLNKASFIPSAGCPLSLYYEFLVCESVIQVFLVVYPMCDKTWLNHVWRSG